MPQCLDRIQPSGTGRRKIPEHNADEGREQQGQHVDRQVDPGRRTIALGNRWRILVTVYRTADNSDAVRALIDERMRSQRTAERAQGPSPLRADLLHTKQAVLACVPVFLLAGMFGQGLLMPLLPI